MCKEPAGQQEHNPLASVEAFVLVQDPEEDG